MLSYFNQLVTSATLFLAIIIFSLGANSESVTQNFDLQTVDAGPGKNYHPEADDTQRFSLYRIHYVYQRTTSGTQRSCVKMQYIEDQMSRNNCLATKNHNIEADEISVDLEDGDNQTPYRRYTSGDFAGKEAWEYHCLTDQGIALWSKSECP